MKKLCILLLVLALVLSGASAFAAEGDMILARGETDTIYFSRAFSDGDTLYLGSGNELYTWRAGEAELTKYVSSIPEESEVNTYVSIMPFICDDQLYALTATTRYEGDISSFEGAALNALTLEDDGTLSIEALRDVDLDALVEYYDEDSYFNQPDIIVGAAGKAYLRHYNSQYDYVVSALDLDTGELEEIEDLHDAYCLIPYRDDTLLVEQYTYAQSDVARLLVYDPEDESAWTLAELQIAEYNPLNGMAYDGESDTLYCLKGGEVCPVDLSTGEVGAGVTDMPLEAYGNTAACVLNGGYYAFAAEGLAVRNLDPAQKAEIRLKIVDSSYSTAVTEAYTRFSNAHGDVSVVLSRDYNESQNLIEDMMNRDDSVDIYTLYTNNPTYDALYKRGYLMELDGSEEVAALAERMYPSLRDCLSANGRLVAVPVELYNSTFGVNAKALEALGLTMEDVPDNWWDFLDFLPTLEEPLAEKKGVTLSYQGMTASDMRTNLFYQIFEDYQRYVNIVDPGMGYDTELLRGLMHKLEDVDFLALGCEEDVEDDEMTGRAISIDEDAKMLFETGTGATIGNSGYGDMTPVLMGLDADTRCPMVLEAAVAFVNPFTRHPEQAMAFMEDLVRSLSIPVRYNIDPSLNEPVRGAQNEQYMEELQQNLEDMRAELAEAEPSEAQMLEENLQNLESAMEYMDKNAWDASESAIEWYRANAEGVVLAPVNWLYADESGEAWELMSQYRQGGISVEEMLKGIDRKVQMMLLEGN